MKRQLPIYEGVFFNNNDINLRLSQIDRVILLNKPKNFHTTSTFKPSEDHSKWYGEKVSCYIDTYKSCSEAGAEGFHIAKLVAENKELQAHLDSISKNWHITLSFNRKAVDTNNVDFSKGGSHLKFKITGVFQGFF